MLLATDSPELNEPHNMTVPCSQLILLAPAKLESGLPLCLFP